MKFKFIKVEDKTEYLKSKQKYIPCLFSGHKHLPIVFRVILKGNYKYPVFGNAFKRYGYVYLMRMFYYMKTENKSHVWYAVRLLQCYIHEFLHIYFYNRIPKKERYDYHKLKSKSWEHNENIVSYMAEIIVSLLTDFEDEINEWINLFAELECDFIIED